MIRTRAKVTHTGPGLDSLLAQFQNQQDMARDAIEAAQPIAQAARALIRKKTGRTHDQITVWADEEAPAGTFTVYVGIPGPEVLGPSSRAWIGRLLEEGRKLEFGSSKRKAYPWLRPANDTLGGPLLMQRYAAIVRRRLGR